MKRPNALVIVLILLTLASVPAAYPAHAQPAITLAPNSGPVGTVVSVTGSGFSPADYCNSGSFSSSGTTLKLSAASCSMLNGQIVSASITVGSQAPGTYTVVLMGSTLDSAQATFTIVPIALNPTSGPPGVTVVVTGGSFSSSDTSVTLSYTPTILASGVTCTVSSGSIAPGCSFTVSNTAPIGGYTVNAKGNMASDSYSATFTVQITPPPSISLNPTSGPVGTVVTVSGSGFAPGDAVIGPITNCQAAPDYGISSPTSATMISSPATCTFTASGALNPFTFNVGNVPTGAYIIQVMGDPVSDIGQATFTVTGPTITVTPSSGPVGTVVTVSGSGFAVPDAGSFVAPCSQISSPTPAVIASGTPGACTFLSSGVLSPFTFTVGNVAPGSYFIQVTGFSIGDVAQATFTVTTSPAPTISLTPTSGPPGVTVVVSGSGFSPSDTSVALSYTPTSLASVVTCPVSSGTISAGCSFTVSNSAPLGAYSVTATGGPVSDFVSTSFTVANTATISLSAPSGSRGVTVVVSGSGFSPSDTFVTLGSFPSGLSSSVVTCPVSSGTISAGCSFTVSSTAALGGYSVTATGNTVSDSVSAIFTVTSSTPPPTISLTPTSGPRGVTVVVSGSGFSPSDTLVMFGSFPTGLGSSGVTCPVSSGTISVGCSFTVSNTAPYGGYAVTATGNAASDFVSATFTVTNTATIALSPTSGAEGATVVVSGTNFSPSDTMVTLSNTPTGLGANGASCPVSSGTISIGCSFTVSNTAPYGGYTVTATGNTAGDIAQTTFIVISPTIVLSPTFGPIGTPTAVTISGSNFDPADVGPCTLSSFPSGLFAPGASCSSSGTGQVSASFTVNPSASGSYTVTVTGSPGLDSASALFAVGIVAITSATVTSLQTSTSSTSTTTTFSTTTTSTISATTNTLLVSGTTSVTTTVTGKTAGTITTVFTSTVSTSISTISQTTSVGMTTLQTGVTTVGTGTISSTSTGSAFTTTTSGGTVMVSQTDTFNVLLTTIYQELHQFADETLQFLGVRVSATPLGKNVNQVIVTVTTPIKTTTVSSTTTLLRTTTILTSPTLSTSTTTTAPPVIVASTTLSPLITGTISTTVTTTSSPTGTFTVTSTQILSTSTSTSGTTVSSFTTTLQTVLKTSTASATVTSSSTSFSTTTSSGTVQVTQTDIFSKVVTSIIQLLHQLVTEITKILHVNGVIVKTPVGRIVHRVTVVK